MKLSPEVKKIVDKMKKHQAVIAKERDQLRELYEELQGLVENLDDGLNEIGYGIDKLSELL